MEENYNNRDKVNISEFDRPQQPSGLNIVSILTIIGCVFQFFGSLWSFYSAKKTYETKDEILAKMNSGEMPAFMKTMMGDMTHFEEMVTNGYNNRLPILIFSLVATMLCFVGVMQMRKLKKQGYLLYVIGELLPFVSMLIFIGTFALAGFGFYIGLAIAALFIYLYTTYKKYMV